MRISRIALVMSLVCLLAMSAAVHASAQPEPGPGSAPVVSWRQLGQSDKIVLLGANQPTDVELNIPAGVGLRSITGQIGSVVHVTSGRVDVLDSRGILLGTIPASPDPATQPFRIDASAAPVVNGVAKLSFVLRDASPAVRTCEALPSVTLTQLASGLSVAPAEPRTVADFRPGYLSRIMIRIGPDAGQDVQQAALTLVAQLSSQYRPLPVRIDVDTAAGAPPPTSADTRVIEIKNGPKPAMTVRDPGAPGAVLEIVGTGETLLDQVALFSDRRVDLAQAPSASVTSVRQTVTPATRTLTFDQLGMASNITVQGSATLYTGFDAGAFRVGPVDNARLHVIARYTPVEKGEGSLLLRSGRTVLATRTLDSTGSLDLVADIPAEEIASDTGLAFDVQYLPRQECAPLADRLTFVIDPASTVSVTPGTGNRGGFAALPMALAPEFAVALGNPDLIRYAAQAINLMGQKSGTPLRPMIRPFDEAVRSATPLLIVADADRLGASGLPLPLAPGTGTGLTVNGDPVTAVDLNGPVGSIQGFTAGRTVLAIGGTTDWNLVDRSFDFIRGLEDGWASLRGDVVATGARNVTVNLTVREGGVMARRPIPPEAWRWWTWVTVGVAAVAAAATVAALLIRRRRRAHV